MYPKFKIIFIIIFANYIYAECDSYSQFTKFIDCILSHTIKIYINVY